MKRPGSSQSPSPEEMPTEQVAERGSIDLQQLETVPNHTRYLGKNSQPAFQRRRSSLRAGIAVVAGRTAGAISRRLHLGGGTSIVGAVAQRLYPNIIEHLATQLEYGSILITGTNGKTTTSSFIAAIIRDSGLRVWRNREGSNLMRGVAGALVIRAEPNGNLRRSGHAISVLETDEVALPGVVQAVATPRAIVFTNLFRDQLDRYGEVDTIMARWKQTIKQLPTTTTLVLNADDPTIAQLAEGFEGRVVFFGINDLSLDEQQTQNDRHQAIDARRCTRCGHEYTYTTHFYSHLGHYRCDNCGTTRPQPNIQIISVHLDKFDRYRITVNDDQQIHTIVVPLPGLYNIYNALAAISVARVINIDWAPITTGIEQFKPAFGRGERVMVDGRTLRLLLAKNPTGLNEVLRTLATDQTPRYLLMVLNDHIADGRDVSWIWDVDFEQAIGKIAHVVVAGTRALDLALRLRYAGLDSEKITIVPPAPLRAARPQRIRMSNKHLLQKTIAEKTAENSAAENLSTETVQIFGIKNALDSALQQTPTGETLFAIPTYTGLLEVHRELELRGLTPHYWEGKEA